VESSQGLVFLNRLYVSKIFALEFVPWPFSNAVRLVWLFSQARQNVYERKNGRKACDEMEAFKKLIYFGCHFLRELSYCGIVTPVKEDLDAP